MTHCANSVLKNEEQSFLLLGSKSIHGMIARSPWQGRDEHLTQSAFFVNSRKTLHTFRLKNWPMQRLRLV
jgi:hypothetical protein